VAVTSFISTRRTASGWTSSARYTALNRCSRASSGCFHDWRGWRRSYQEDWACGMDFVFEPSSETLPETRVFASLEQSAPFSLFLRSPTVISSEPHASGATPQRAMSLPSRLEFTVIARVCDPFATCRERLLYAPEGLRLRMVHPRGVVRSLMTSRAQAQVAGWLPPDSAFLSAVFQTAITSSATSWLRQPQCA